jgi:hypothetical protein
LRSLQAYLSTHRYIRMLRTKASKPISRDNVPTATLHSGLSNSKITTAPTPKVTIHAHQATNSALPKLMSINIPGHLGDDERCTSCNCAREIMSAVSDRTHLTLNLRYRALCSRRAGNPKSAQEGGAP